MSKYVKLILTLLLFNSVIFSQSTLKIGKATFAGNPTLVPISVTGTALTNVKSISLQIKYDPSSISFNHDVTSALSGFSGITLPETENISAYSSNGLITISWFNSTGVSLSGLLFNLGFNYTSSFSEIRIVSATIRNMSGAKLLFTTENGCIAPNTNPAIVVQYPNGAESLEVTGSPTTITWKSVYVNQVNIQYTDDGSTWNPVINNYDATLGSYDWTIPAGINSGACKIKITDSDPASTASDESNSNFTINSTPVLSLISPNGGEDLKTGGVKKISWTFKNVLNVRLEYSLNASDPTPSWTMINSSIPAKNAYFDWDIPSGISSNCKIRITDLATVTNDLSNAVFSISNPPVSVTIPKVVEAHLVKIGKVIPTGIPLYSYVWSEAPGYIWKSENAQFTFSDHSTYTAPDTLIVNGKVPVNVGWLTNLSYFEMKLSFNPTVLLFDSLALMYPGMKPLSVSVEGNIIHVIWSGNAPIDIHDKIFDICFTYKNFTKPEQWLNPWMTILPPTTPTVVLDPRNYSDLKIEMITARNSKNNIIDASSWINGSLSISNAPFVKILSPIGGETLEYNDGTYEITWAGRDVTNVSLAYSTNNGSDWNEIIHSTPSDGSYIWTIPNVNSTQCLFKIMNQDVLLPADASPKKFTITNTVSLDLTSPDGGDIIKVGSNKIITWASRNISNVKLEYTTNYNDPVKVWTAIAASVEAKKYAFTWLIPNTPSANCGVRISDVLTGLIVDTSSGNFEINNSKVNVSLATMTSAPTGNITVPVTVDKVNSVTFINLSVKYNPVNLTFDFVQSSAALQIGQVSATIDRYTASPDEIVRIVWISSTPCDANGILFNIHFKNFNGANTPLIFDSPNVFKDQNNKVIPINLVNGLTDVVTTNLPIKFAVYQNFPNPFNPSTSIRFELPKGSKVNLTIYNILGQKIATLVDEYKNPGYYQVKWDARNLANGIYLYAIRTENIFITKKMILLK